jgi:outer membrane autotransporter protein
LVDIETIAGSKIATVGKGARGVNIDKLTGEVIVNVGTVGTKGENAAGIHVYNGTLSGTGTGGAITITANSVVTTGNTVKGASNHYEVGASAYGIDVFNIGAGEAGKITIDTSVGVDPDTLGIVSVSGRKATGIAAMSGRLVDGNVSAGGGAIDIKTGTVTATGDFGRAIGAETFGSGADGAITIRTLGTVSASGANLFYPSGDVENEGNTQPNAIYAVSWGGGDVSITTKDVSSAGDSAPAIFAQSGNGDLNAGIGKVTIDTTGGTVSAKGSASAAISVGGSSGPVSVKSGDIKTEGWSGYGIQVSNTGTNSSITIDTTGGKITTSGDLSNGVGASAGNFAYNKPNAGLLKITTGAIEVTGKGSSGVTANAFNGNIEVEVKGAITTGEQSSYGVFAGGRGTSQSKVTVASSGSIKTVGTSAHAIYVTSTGGGTANTVVVNGSVRAEGATANGVLINGSGDEVTVNSNGSVYGTSAGVRFQETNGNAKVTNAGTITGGGSKAVEFLGAATATFDNDGTVNGDVLMGSGNDTAILRSNSAINGNLNGQTGTNKLELTGAGVSSSLDTAKVLNFQSAEKTGTGTWALTGTNAEFVSTLDVKAGKLAANATLTGTAVTVEDGATLGGIGILDAITVKSGGKLAPGNSVGTLTAASAIYEAGAIYEVEVEPGTGSGPFLADKLVVQNTVTIDPTATVHVLVTAGTYNDADRQIILQAGTRVGAFAPTVVDNSAFLDFTLDQSIAGEVWLEVTKVADLPDVAETPNQIAAAGGIDEQGAGFPLFDAIIPLDADGARHAFDLASGEIHATVPGALLDDSRFIREAIFDRLGDKYGAGWPGGGGVDLTVANLRPRASAWGRVFGSNGTAGGDGNAAGFSRSIGGFLAGIETGDPGLWRAGLVAGYRRAGVSVAERASTAMVGVYEIAAYGAVASGPLALRFGGAYGGGTINTIRNVAFPGFDETLTASYGVRTAQAFGEVAYRGRIGAIGIEPFANVAFVSANTDGFTESGGLAALSGGPQHRSMTIGSIGARFATELPAIHARMTALIAWQHRWGKTTPAADLAFTGGTPFTVAGTPRARDSLRIDAGLEWDIGKRSKFALGYSGQFAAGGSDHGVRATFSIRF